MGGWVRGLGCVHDPYLVGVRRTRLVLWAGGQAERRRAQMMHKELVEGPHAIELVLLAHALG